jgi:lipid-A-disaccharide synthase
LKGNQVKVVFGETYRLLQQASAALVTSGTATLETALFGVPQVVCYHTPIGKVISLIRRHVLKVKYISLVNLIAGREVVKELVADTMTVANIQKELNNILEDGPCRRVQLHGYEEMSRLLGPSGAAQCAAEEIVKLLLK